MRTAAVLPCGAQSLPAGALKRLHIDKAAMAAGEAAVIAIRIYNAQGDETSYARVREAWIRDESAFSCRRETPLTGGTYAWVETYGEVVYWR